MKKILLFCTLYLFLSFTNVKAAPSENCQKKCTGVGNNYEILECLKNCEESETSHTGGDTDGTVDGSEGGNFSGFEEDKPNCGNIFGKLGEWINNAFKLVTYVGAALGVVLSVMDFVKVITSGNDGELKKTFDKFIKRLIAIVLLILTPVLINFILNIASDALNGDTCSSVIQK